MLILFAALTVLTAAPDAYQGASTESIPLPVPRLAGTWNQDVNVSELLGESAGIFQAIDSLTFHNRESWDSMRPPFVELGHEKAPMHIGGVELPGGDEALFLLRGRLGYLEIGSPVGGKTPIAWERLHLVEGEDKSKDMLIIGRSAFRRK